MKLDAVSIGLIALAGMISIYFATFEKGFIAVFPAILLTVGLALMIVSEGRVPPEDTYVSESEGWTIIKYFGIGFIGIVLVAWLSPALFRPASIIPKSLSITDMRLFGVLMAVAEETFFRGFLMNWLINQFGSATTGILLQALIFAVYHIAVYGSSFATLLYVLIAGLILGYVAWRSGRLSSSMLAHSLINFIAV